MSTEIEQRILQMKFDNAKFENGVKTTMSTLDKLKSSLNFKGIEKGFNNISTAAKNVDVSAIGRSADAVTVQFDAMQVFILTMFQRLSNAAITTGKNIISAFTIEPITTGFKEYELKMNSVQTIMASTGAEIGVVNKYLEELNEYSDKTIYSFSDMTESIGKFTNAGVSLDDAVMAIKGISNEAAVSGANANEASRAMYNFAQALSAGHVKLMDWKSIEYANMATNEFKQQLIDTAVATGTLTAGLDGMYYTTSGTAITSTKNFNESLQDQWMTTEVLVGTLKDYADETTDIGKKAFAAAQDVKTFSQMMDASKEAAQSGWAMTWEILIGDLEEAKAFYTNINNVIGDIIGNMADARNNLLQGWKDLGGRDALIKGLGNIMSSLGGIIKSVGDAFRAVFPPTTSKQLYGITTGFLKLTEVLKPSENTLNAVKMAFQGVFSVLKIFTTILTIPLKFIPILTDLFAILGSVITKVAGFFGMLTSGIFGFVSAGDAVNSIFNILAGAIGFATGHIRDFITNVNVPMSFDALKEAVPAFGVISDAANTAKDAFMKYGKQAIETFKEVDKQAMKNKVAESLEKTVDFVMKMYDGLKSKVGDILSFGKDMLNTAMGNMKKFIEWVDWKQVFEFFTGAVAAKFFLTLASVMKKLSSAFETVAKNTSIIKDISKGVTDVLDRVGDSLKTWQNSLRASNLMKIGLAIGVISASVLVLSRIDVDKLIPAMAAMGALFVSLTASSILLAKFAEGGSLKGLMGMGVAILILSKAVAQLAAIDPVKMTVGIAGIMALITSLGAYTVVMSKMKAQITSGALVLLAFSTAILILTAAVLKLTNIDAGKLAIAMAGIVALSLSVAASSKILAKGDDGKGSLKLMAFASSIKILSKATKILSEIPFTSMIKGIGGLGLIMLELGVFSRLVSDKKMISVAIGMNILAVALTAMLVPLNILGRMDVGVFATGLSMIGSMILALGISLKAMPNNLPVIAFGLNMVSTALVVMSGAMAIVGNLEWSTIIKSLFGFGVALGGLAIALNAMTGTIGGSAALVLASGALVVFAAAIGLMGSLSLGTIMLGIIGFAGALGVLSVTSMMLAPLAPVLAGISVALLSFTTSVLIGTVAVGAFGVALVALAAGFTALVGLGASVFKMIEMFVKTIAGLVPIIGKAAADLVVVFIEGLSRGKNAIRSAMVDLILVTLEAINEVVPAFVETVLNVIEKVFESLAKHAEPIIKNMVKFLIGVIRGISTHLPELISEAVQLVVALFVGIADAMSQINIQDLGKVVIGAGILSLVVMAASAILPLLPGAALALAGLGGIVMEMIGILGLIGGIAQIPGLKWLIGEGGEMLQSVGKAIGKFAGGIVGGIAEGIMSTLPTFGTYLSEFMTNAKPFFDGMNNVDDGLVSSMAALAGAVAIITATSFVDGIVRFFNGGESPLVKFGKELAAFAPYYKTYAMIMSTTNGDELVKTSNAVKSLGEFVKMVPSQGGLSGLLLGEKDLVGFGKALAEFGPYFAQYARSVAGINAESVTASSTAATSIAEFAKLVPNQGGLVSLLTGDNSLAQWGEELAKFGPTLKQYSDSVKGVDAGVVTNSVNAATAIAKFADLIPNKGGLVALFTGDNSLSSLAKDLAKFGPSLKAYSDSVANVSLTSINASVMGSTKMIELAKIIPQGKIRLSVLGDELEDFGKSLGKYYERTSGINTSTLTSGITAITKLVEMCKNIEGVNVYGLEQFSEGLKRLGSDGVDKFTSAFSGSHDKAKTAVSGFINAAISALNADIAVMGQTANSMMSTILSSITLGSPAVTSAMTTMFMGLNTIVQNGGIAIRTSMISMVDVLALTIIHKSPAVASAMSTLMDQIVIAVQSKSSIMISAGSILVSNLAAGMLLTSSMTSYAVTTVISTAYNRILSYNGSFRSAGSNLISSLTAGMNSASYNTTSSVSRMLSSIRSSILSQTSSFRSAGVTLIQALSAGIASGAYSVSNTGRRMANDAAYAIKGYYWTWYYSGKYLVEGFANGITDYTYLATARARNMANAANNSARNALGIHSPSRVGAEIGKYFVEGFAGGIQKNMDQSTDQSATMANKAKTILQDTLSNMYDMIDGDMDYTPVITPVLDLSNVERNSGMLDNMFSTNIAAQTSYGMSRRLAQNAEAASTNNSKVENIYNNKFNIVARPEDDPTAVANEVSRIIQLQVERRDAVWE